jgi:hypothetical protein
LQLSGLKTRDGTFIREASVFRHPRCRHYPTKISALKIIH